MQMYFKQELDICVIISKKKINNGQRQNAGEVANYKILHIGQELNLFDRSGVDKLSSYKMLQRVVYGERRHKEFKGFAKWTRKLQTERT